MFEKMKRMIADQLNADADSIANSQRGYMVTEWTRRICNM